MIISLLFFHLIFLNVKAQHPAAIPYDPSDTSGFQPSLVAVIGILAIMFSLTFFLLLYAKFCHRASILNTTLQIPDGLLGSWRRSSGIDKTVVESLPFFRFSSLKGSREGLECAVCLSRFEDIEILRLLPKCKHAFHIDCIDQWLEKHSSCPLCRHKVSAEDLSVMSFSSSLRFLRSSQSDLREDSSLGLYIQREESFKLGSRKIKKDEKLPIQQQSSSSDHDQSLQKPLHHLNHRIVVSDVVLKNRWSSVSSSDLMALTSELIHDAASYRFSSSAANHEFSSSESFRQHDEIQTMSIKEEMERKRLFEIKINMQNASLFPVPTTSAEPRMASESETKLLTQNEKRSMSEIVVHPRFRNGNLQHNSDVVSDGRNVRDERRTNLWLPIARRTVQWFAKRERRSADQSQIPSTTQHNP